MCSRKWGPEGDHQPSTHALIDTSWSIVGTKDQSWKRTCVGQLVCLFCVTISFLHVSPVVNLLAQIASKSRLKAGDLDGFIGGPTPRMVGRFASTSKLLSRRVRTMVTSATSAVANEPSVATNLAGIRARIDAAAKATGVPAPRLVAVSKTKPVEALMEAYEAGHRVFGENYVHEIVEKAPQMPADVQWHFIGHLQSNKAKVVAGVPNVVLVETIDSTRIADKLNTAVQNAGRTEPLGVLIQVDTSGEETKAGVGPEEAPALANHILGNCPHLRLKGVMTIGAPGDMSCFDKLVEARASVAACTGLEASSLELSMGMSGDFEDAISKGSTNVRVGSSIFGERDYSKKK